MDKRSETADRSLYENHNISIRGDQNNDMNSLFFRLNRFSFRG